MVTLVRAARVLLLILLVTFVLSLVIAVARPETGPLEKTVLVALMAGCVVAAARVSTMATAVVTRLQHR